MTCQEVVERLVAGTDRGGAGQCGKDPSVAEHARSCMSCFRAMTELRDIPRLAEALREAAPAPDPGERFWEALAERAADGVSVALASGAPAQPPGDRRRRLMSLRARVVSFGALAVAAAASWVVVARHPAPPMASRAAAPVVAGATGADVARSGVDDANGALAEVADLDTGALHRLLDRLGRHASAPLATTASGDDGADIPVDDEARVTDEVAELDGDALRRVASSLEAGAL
jgi:hypothetical protein